MRIVPEVFVVVVVAAVAGFAMVLVVAAAAVTVVAIVVVAAVAAVAIVAVDVAGQQAGTASGQRDVVAVLPSGPVAVTAVRAVDYGLGLPADQILPFSN